MLSGGTNRKNLIKLYLAGLFLILLVGLNCKDNSVDTSSTGAFYPISVGNTWYYNYNYYDSLGNILDERIIKETFVGTRNKLNSLVYLFDSPLNPGSPACCNYVFYYQNRSDGVHEYIASDTMGYWVDDIHLYKYPCIENDYFTNGINESDTTFVISLNDTVFCEAGTFSCIVYKNLIKDLDTYTRIIGYVISYVAYGVGKVKVERFLSNSLHHFYKDMEYTLKSYSIN